MRLHYCRHYLRHGQMAALQVFVREVRRCGSGMDQQKIVCSGLDSQVHGAHKIRLPKGELLNGADVVTLNLKAGKAHRLSF